MDIRTTHFGTTGDGLAVRRYQIRNSRGTQLDVMDYGATLVGLVIADRNGEPGDVVLGFDSLRGYLDSRSYLGASIGRHANRIADGRFMLDGREHRLSRNEGQTHLHGGLLGFDKRVWTAHAEQLKDSARLTLGLHSPAGDQGYPGNLTVQLSYTLDDQDGLRLDYRASTDAPTIVNLTNHAYFNLGAAQDILDHRLQVSAGQFLPVDTRMIPTGERRAVAGTPFDLRRSVRLRDALAGQDQQLTLGRGFDHCWVLDGGGDASEPVLAAMLSEPRSGRAMRLYSSEPGLQVYTGNLLVEERGKLGRSYRRHAGLCLEAQHFPDAPNRPGFPPTVLRPGQEYRQTTVLRFGIGADA